MPMEVEDAQASGTGSGTGTTGDGDPMDEDEDAAELEQALQMSMGEAAAAEVETVGPGLSPDFQGNYEMFAVVTHQGRFADGGHYIGWVRQDSDNWLVSPRPPPHRLTHPGVDLAPRLNGRSQPKTFNPEQPTLLGRSSMTTVSRSVKQRT